MKRVMIFFLRIVFVEHPYKKAGELVAKNFHCQMHSVRPSLRMQTQTLIGRCNNSTSGSLSDYHAYLQQMLSIR